ncbi:hypothetical protein B484DRAFT_67403 [Ochromonadaceae sp. CCMP2298]|nr:hypothetical protein B484DRAFT_67403 [Ochromonadaceae sp. CCMP2298]
MGVIFWRVYYTVFLLCLLQTLLSDRVRHSSGERDRLAPLKTLCVDNTRTNSWWTYIICFHGDVLQVHYDGRSKQLKEKIHLGSYDPQASTASRHVYSNSTLSCGKEMLPRQVEVVLECCTQLEAMRQSRHSHHSSAERVAMHAHATLKSTTATAGTHVF